MFVQKCVGHKDYTVPLTRQLKVEETQHSVSRTLDPFTSRRERYHSPQPQLPARLSVRDMMSMTRILTAQYLLRSSIQ